MLPAVIGAFYLAQSIIEIPTLLVLGLILRKATEWLIEIELASREKSNDFSFARKYIFANAISFLVLIASFPLPKGTTFYYILYIWAVTPALFLLPSIQRPISSIQDKLEFIKFIPHLGSSTIIGTSTYILRLLIVLLAGKALAGQMFTAYALGGLISAIYTYAIGPTLVLRNKGNAWKPVVVFAAVFFILGLTLTVVSKVSDLSLYSSLFMDAVGISIIGGAVMLLAQHKRLHILQVCKQDVFVPDALANILLLSSVPFAFYLLGDKSLSFIFLWSALLNFMLYLVLYYKKQQVIA